MSDYSKITNFTAKDALTTGDPEKIALGADIDAELNAIATMSATKEDEVNKGAANGYCPLDSGGKVDRSDLPAAVDYLDSAQVYTAGKGSAWVELTDAATVAVDAELGNHFKLVPGGNRTIDEPTNLQDGQVFTFLIKQDGTGSRTITWASIYQWPGNTAPTLSTGANDIDIFTGVYHEDLDLIFMSTFGLNFE